MGFEHFRVSKAGAPFRHGKNGASGSTSKVRRADSTTQDPSCATGSFYSSPAHASSVDSLSPLNIVWRPELTCLLPVPSLVDVYLYAPGDTKAVLYTWYSVPYAPGNHTVDLMPRWWNSTESKQLQLMIVPSDTPVFLSTIPAGPVFTATYTPPTSGSVPAAADTSLSSGDSDHTTVTATGISGVSSHSMSAGKKAAAVLLPLLFVILLGLAYLKISRARGQAKRSAWSEKLDKRMSTISADWKAITPGGAKEAVRHSIANRNSSAFGFGSIRPGAIEGEPVVMGEKPGAPLTTRGGSIEISEKDLPRTSLGSGVGVGVGARRPRTHANPPDRGSRAVSFADSAHPRPSLSSARYSRGSRAFHTASYAAEDDADLPPVPALPSPARAGAFGAIERISSERNSTFSGAGNAGNAVYQNGAAWSSGERVEGVDGGYGAQAVSPTGRVHTVNYPASMLNTSDDDAAFAYGTPAEGSYFSPVTPTPGNTFTGMGVYEPSADSAYAPTTFGAFPSPNPSDVSSGVPSGVTSPRQIGGPLTLTPEDIRRRMTLQNAGQEGWRQSVDEVFGALSMMRTGTSPASPDADAEDDDGGDYLFASPLSQDQESETVFQYPGTPAPGSAFSSPAIPAASPFAMPMQPPTMSPDDMLRAYAAKHASTISTTGARTAEVVPSLKDTGMRVLYKQPDGAGANEARAQSPALIRAGPGARLSR